MGDFAARLRAWHVDKAIASFSDAQIDAILWNARTNAAYALRSGDAVWRQAAPSASEMLAIISHIDKLELALLSSVTR